MATQRNRATSPGAPRIYLDAPRSSTGTMLTSTFDPRYDTRLIRSSFSTVPSSSSGRNNSIYETQPVSKRTYADSSHPGATISRTEYAVRPRRESATGESRRPLGVLTKNASPTRDRPDYVESPRDMVTYKAPTRDDTTSRLLQPSASRSRGSGHHQRHNSATRTEGGRYSDASVAAPRVERSYHGRNPYVEKVSDPRPSLPRYVEEPTVEYTGPREQFERDYPTKSRHESLSRRERPTSALESRGDPFRRDTAPPSASRQLQRIEREERRSGFESDPDRSRHHKPRRPSRGPVVHQREEGYSSAREDYDARRPSKYASPDEIHVAGANTRYREANKQKDRSRRDPERDDERPPERDKRQSRPHDREYERERDRDRDRDRDRHKDYEVIEEEDSHPRSRRRDTRDSRENSPDRSTLKTIATAAVGGLAAAGIVSKKSKDDEVSETEGKKEHRRRHRKPREARDDNRREDEDPEARRRRKEKRSRKNDGSESSGSDTPEDDTSRKRPQSRTRQRRNTQDQYGSDRERPQLALPAPEMERRPSREPYTGATYEEATPTTAPERSQDSPTNRDGRTISPGEGEDARLRRVSIVDPVNKREDLKPKGILKKPREVPFPEDPNPQREGVAPLKQAGKEGIPPGARWTKISRILVNPEALEKAHLRYEERDDYVIVLKVLSREEIEKLAEKTREVREQRERELEKQATTNGERQAESDGDCDDRRRAPLAIEPPPSAPPADLRQYAAQNTLPQQQQQSQHAYPPQQQNYQQHYPPQQYASPNPYPGQPPVWQNPESARNSAEAMAATAPGQPLPSQQSQSSQQSPQFDAGAYSQNV